MRRKPIFHSAIFAMLVLLCLGVPVRAASPDIQWSVEFLSKADPIPTYMIG